MRPLSFGNSHIGLMLDPNQVATRLYIRSLTISHVKNQTAQQGNNKTKESHNEGLLQLPIPLVTLLPSCSLFTKCRHVLCNPAQSHVDALAPSNTPNTI